jgi:magnesium transporter
MVKCLRICDGKLVECESADAPVQVYVAPQEAEKKYLIETLKIDEHTLASALDPDELSRLEFEPEHAAIIIKRPKNYSSEDQYLFRVMPTGLFLFKDRLVIVVPDDSPLFDGKPSRVLNPADVMLRLVYRMIFHFEAHLKIINAISGELEGAINKSMENQSLLNLFTLEKSLVFYLNAINSNGTVMDKIRANAPRLGLASESLELLDDIVIENSQCLKQAEIYSDILASLMDARVSIVSNNLNILMKKLNIIMITIMVPTLVVSMFSMNVAFPLRDHPNAFWAILSLAVCSSFGIWLFWKYKKL